MVEALLHFAIAIISHLGQHFAPMTACGVDMVAPLCG
jgi:hypothetical protein